MCVCVIIFIILNYLIASPAVVAASCVSGHISSPFSYSGSNITDLSAFIRQNPPRDSASDGDQPLIDEFENSITGDIVFCDQDNIDTDG